MPRLLLMLACTLVLAACSGANTGLQNLQFSGAEEPFPTDYQARVVRYLGEQPTAGMMVSYPQTIVGESAWSPRRWYVCVLGVPAPGPAPRTLKPVFEAAGDVLGAPPRQDVYHIVLVLRPSGTATAIKSFDAPLCSNGRYEALAVS